MKIVVTDGYTLNPGDLSWNAIHLLGDLIVYDRTPADTLIERCRDADIILTNKVPFARQQFAELPKLKMISVLATGYNVIDIVAAKEHNIIVSNVPAYGTASVAQHVFALLLELTNHVGKNADSVAQGKWQQSADWCYTQAPVMELAYKIFGIVGFGNIGQQTARIAATLGMKVMYYNPHPKQSDIAIAATLMEVFERSDVVSLHCPATKENQEFVNRELLSSMKSTAIIINTARGQLINESDLANALNNQIIGGAALDVLSAEPPQSSNPLLTAKNCIITPHNAWISREARTRIMEMTVQNIKAFLEGKPLNMVTT